ncbi:MAG: YihY/virulence factor BrkB family protein [Hymenobacteraceae bacterium]|nr:YihY/virulence factor BrkB family protein [Hymenobacteraceae bacterium]MDX5512319.1 YihY/virulence factor BrkB family protein [Hymenobacteraceae bacterium]
MADYTFKDIFKLAKSSGSAFMKNNSLRLAAALAFNTIFSLPPLLLLLVKIAGMFLGDAAVSGKLYEQTQSVIGTEAAEGVQTILQNESLETGGVWTAIIGIGTLVFAATTFFITLQESLNTIWNIKVKPENSFLKVAKDRFLSFGMILGIALLMLVSFLISAMISFLSDYIREMLPGFGYYAARILDLLVSFGITGLLFALIYRFLPDAIIRWKDTLIGAYITAFLFVLGKFLISWYIGNSNIGSTYGAAGSVILILVWIYYSSLIVFYGAEFTQQYAARYGVRIKPKEHAVRVEEREIRQDDQANEQTGRPPSEGRFRKE